MIIRLTIEQAGAGFRATISKRRGGERRRCREAGNFPGRHQGRGKKARQTVGAQFGVEDLSRGRKNPCGLAIGGNLREHDGRSRLQLRKPPC